MTSERFNPVAWTEGMFLRPHHLQQHQLFAEERLAYHLHTLNPFYWGVRELEIDEEALSDNQLVINRLDAVLPSGVILRHPGNAIVESRKFDATEERFDVHVGIHRLSATEANSAPHGNGAQDVRYLVKTHELPDLNRSGYVSPVELAHPNVRVFFSGEENALELHESIKIAEVVATQDLKRRFALSPTYVPPLLLLQASKILDDDVNRIVNQIAAMLRVVAGRPTSVTELKQIFMRYTLARMTPVFRHLLGTGATQPFELYTALVETAGSLAAHQTTEPAALPSYDHNDLYSCYHRLIEFIDAELGRPTDLVKRLILEFQSGDKVYASHELNTNLVSPRNLYFLAVKAQLDSAELSKWVVENGKASSHEGVKTLVILNVGGLRLEHLSAAPTEIPSASDFQYFKVDPHGAQWTKVKDEFSFALSLGRLEDAEVHLYIVTPEP